MALARSVALPVFRRGLLLLALALAVSGCASSHSAARRGVERGVASWYGPGFHGRDTASGEPFDTAAFTAAHRTLPFDTVVEVTNLDNGLSTTVRINDRGPFAKNRIIDLSNAAAQAIGMIGPGTARVELRILGIRPSGRRWTVQVGAFQDRALADALVARLGGGYPAVAIRTDDVWHRVQIGDFTDRGEADSLRKKLQRAGFSAVVVPAKAAPSAPGAPVSGR